MGTIDDAPGGGPFYYNTETHQVEEGRQSTWTHLMGPFATRAEAEGALQRAAARTEAWDRQDEADRR